MSEFFLSIFHSISISKIIKSECVAYILVVFSFSIVSISCNEEEKPLNLPPYSIGYIPFSQKQDDPNFELCDDTFILENGGSQSSYTGGVKSVVKYFQSIKGQLKYIKGVNGYLTVRFIMNCKGEKNRY